MSFTTAPVTILNIQTKERRIKLFLFWNSAICFPDGFFSCVYSQLYFYRFSFMKTDKKWL